MFWNEYVEEVRTIKTIVTNATGRISAKIEALEQLLSETEKASPEAVEALNELKDEVNHLSELAPEVLPEPDDIPGF